MELSEWTALPRYGFAYKITFTAKMSTRVYLINANNPEPHTYKSFRFKSVGQHKNHVTTIVRSHSHVTFAYLNLYRTAPFSLYS